MTQASKEKQMTQRDTRRKKSKVDNGRAWRRGRLLPVLLLTLVLSGCALPWEIIIPSNTPQAPVPAETAIGAVTSAEEPSAEASTSNAAPGGEAEDPQGATGAAAKDMEDAQSEKEAEEKTYTLPLPARLRADNSFPAKVLKTQDEEEGRHYYYVRALEEMLRSRTVPRVEGQRVIVAEDEDNRYAMTDIDGDGREELLLAYQDRVRHARVEQAYRYDPLEEKWKRTFSSDGTARFYEGGAIRIELMQETELSGRGQLQSIVLYNKEDDAYDMLAEIEPWDSRSFPGTFGNDAFPHAADEDRNGLVYFAWDAEKNCGDVPMDDAQLDEWVRTLLHGAEEEAVEWKQLTEQNVNSEYRTIFFDE